MDIQDEHHNVEYRLTIGDRDDELTVWYGPSLDDATLMIRIDNDGDESQSTKMMFTVDDLPLLRKVIKIMADAHDDMLTHKTEASQQLELSPEKKAKLKDRYRCSYVNIAAPSKDGASNPQHEHIFGPWKRFVISNFSQQTESPLYFERECSCGERQIKRHSEYVGDTP